MSEDSWPKIGASMGIAAAVLLILSLVFGPSDTPPGFNDSAADVRAFIQDNHSAIQTAVAFQFAAIVAVAWFLGSVFYRLRAAEPAARLSVVALVGGVLTGVGGMIGTVATATAAYHVDTLDPGIVLGIWDLSIFGYLFFLVGLTVLSGATGALGIRAGKKAVPDLVCFYSVGLAIYAFVVGLVSSFSETGAFSPSDGALGLIAFLGFLVWLLAMGITLVREPRASGGTPPAAGP